MCRLRHALYGLKEALLWWFLYIFEHMRKLGFEAVDGEPCLLRKGSILILIYVDDCAIAAPTQAEIDTTKQQFSEACDLKSMGTIEGYLGFEIVRDRPNRRLYLH